MKYKMLAFILALLFLFSFFAAINNTTEEIKSVSWDFSYPDNSSGIFNWTIRSMNGTQVSINEGIKFVNNGTTGEGSVRGFTNDKIFRNNTEGTWSFWVNLSDFQASDSTGSSIIFFGLQESGINNDTFLRFNALDALNRTQLVTENQGVNTKILDIGQTGKCFSCNMNFSEWNMITITWNSSDVKGYVNGIPTNETINNNTFLPIPKPIQDVPFVIGDVVATNINTTFTINNIKIFKKSLTFEEIKLLYLNKSK